MTELLGERIKLVRKEAGLTQKQFGDIFNFEQRTISAWESGNNKPDITIISKIKDYFRINPSWLIDGFGEKYINPENNKKIIAEIDLEHIGNRIKYIRLKNGYTQKDFSRVISISTRTLQTYEQGEVDAIPFPTLKKVAEIFNVSLEWLFYNNGEMDKKLSTTSTDDNILINESNKNSEILNSHLIKQNAEIMSELESIKQKLLDIENKENTLIGMFSKIFNVGKKGRDE